MIVPLVFLLDDFEYEDQAAFDAKYWHRVPNYSTPNHNDAHLTLGAFGEDGSKGVQMNIGEHGVTGWDLLRTKNNFVNTGLTNEYQYFAFWFKGDGVITQIYVWLYWSGSQNSKVINVSNVPAEGGYVYVAISDYGKTATEITQYAIGYNLANNTTKYTIYIDNIMFINDLSALNQD